MPNTDTNLFQVDIIKKDEFSEGFKGKKIDKTYGGLKLKSPFRHEAEHYICVEKDAAFTVRIKVPDRNDENTYGAVLFLDGQRIAGKKTFRGVSNYLGYKLGGGRYSECP